MTLSDAEQEAVWQTFVDEYVCNATWDGDNMRAVLAGPVAVAVACAVERVAARGGTMTADAFAAKILHVRAGHIGWSEEADALEEAFMAQGARLAVAEAENAVKHGLITTLKEQLAATRLPLDAGHGMLEDARRERDAATAIRETVEQDRERYRIVADEMGTERDNASQSESVWRKRLEEVAAELADVAPGELGRLDVLGRVKRLKARLAKYQNPRRQREECTRERNEVDRLEAKLESLHAAKTAGEDTLDRATASEEIAVPDADRFAFDEGAEAMRAACWEDLQELAFSEGWCVHGDKMWTGLKAAIEGTTP